MDELSPPVGQGPRIFAPLMTSKVSQVSIPSGTQNVAPANPNRYYVGFSLGSGSPGGSLKPGTPQTGVEGYQMGTGFLNQEFFFSRHGGLVQGDWYFHTTGGAVTINVIEGLYVMGVGS